MIAIFAPEIVLYSAWQQYFIATSFCHDMYNIKLEQAGLPTLSRKSWFRRSPISVKRHDLRKPKNGALEKAETGTLATTFALPARPPTKFSLTYGFYVLMGGLVVDVSDLYDDVSCMTLTPGKVLDLAKKNSWEKFYVPDETIRDKSKADNLAKGLVILQVSWTLLQCISRQALGYPLTVLEVHTLVHAACAMLMYAFWFRKPLNIGDPSSVDCGSAEDLALELVRSPGSAYAPFTTLKPQTQFQPGIVSHPKIDKARTDLQDQQRSSDPRMSFFQAQLLLSELLRQNSKSASEASFLIFDTSRVQGAQTDGSDTSGHPLIQSSSAEGRASETEGGVPVSDDEVMWINRNTVPSDASQSRSGSSDAQTFPLHGYLTSLHRSQFVNTDEVKVLVTGQTLASGIGPATLFTSPESTRLFRWRRIAAESFHLKRLAPKAMHVHEVDDDGIKELLPPYDTELSRHLLLHKMAISLSKKDLRRWQRAGHSLTRVIQHSDPDMSSQHLSKVFFGGSQAVRWARLSRW